VESVLEAWAVIEWRWGVVTYDLVGHFFPQLERPEEAYKDYFQVFILVIRCFLGSGRDSCGLRALSILFLGTKCRVDITQQ
jgi:hypothetical protein